MVSSATIDGDALRWARVIALLSFVQNALEETTGKRVLPK